MAQIEKLSPRDFHDLVDGVPFTKVIPIGKKYEQDGKKCQKVKILRKGFRAVDAIVVA